MTANPDLAIETSRWSPREGELLAVTLELLQEHGYERLTVDEVAARARASKATIYRRWPTKAELVLAAFIEGIQQVVVRPDTGTLRGDLLSLGDQIREHAREHVPTFRAVLGEVARNPALDDAMQREFFGPRRAFMRQVLQRAVDRGEIDAAAVNDDILDLMPGYLLFRLVVQGRDPTRRTVQALVDEVMLPSLTRRLG